MPACRMCYEKLDDNIFDLFAFQFIRRAIGLYHYASSLKPMHRIRHAYNVTSADIRSTFISANCEQLVARHKELAIRKILSVGRFGR